MSQEKNSKLLGHRNETVIWLLRCNTVVPNLFCKLQNLHQIPKTLIRLLWCFSFCSSQCCQKVWAKRSQILENPKRPTSKHLKTQNIYMKGFSKGKNIYTKAQSDRAKTGLNCPLQSGSTFIWVRQANWHAIQHRVIFIMDGRITILMVNTYRYVYKWFTNAIVP